MTGTKSDSSSEKATDRFVLRLFSPLTAIKYAKDDWGNLEDRSEEVLPAELCSYEKEILDRTAKENLPEEGNRGLAVYLDDPKLEEKIYSMKPTVEAWQGELWGVLEIESYSQLSERESEAVKEYWEGQESDGWGEGFEQQEIKIPEGELYVSFWNSGDEFFLTTEEGLKGKGQEPSVQKGQHIKMSIDGIPCENWEYETIKRNLTVYVRNAQKNADLLANCPHEICEDFALIYGLHVSLDGEKDGSAIINYDMLKKLRVSEVQLKQDAWVNMKHNVPPCFLALNDVMEKLYLGEPIDVKNGALEHLADVDSEAMMYVLTNSNQINGAVYMCDKEVMSLIAERLETDLIVIPYIRFLTY